MGERVVNWKAMMVKMRKEGKKQQARSRFRLGAVSR